jgi:hypothetical protein
MRDLDQLINEGPYDKAQVVINAQLQGVRETWLNLFKKELFGEEGPAFDENIEHFKMKYKEVLE